MADLVTEVTLPSNGQLYGPDVQWRNQLRAPRLKDRGLGDTTRRLKLQANILDKTLVTPLGMSAYDLHTADFIYLNMRQRQLSKGGAPYRITVTCFRCKKKHDIDINLDELEIKYLDKVPELTYTTMTGDVLQLTYVTPRMLDECSDNANSYLEEYPECGMTFEDLKSREFLRFLILSVNGKRLTYPQMTNYIDNLYSDDADGIVATVNDFDFGVQFVRSFICDACGKKVVYKIPTGPMV